MDHKKDIKNLLRKGKRVFVEWDGGTDMRLFNTTIEGSELAPYLEAKIINKLLIPSAGPPRNIGKGEVFINSDNSVILRFSSRIHEESEGYWINEQGELTVWNEYDERVQVEATHTLEPVQLEDFYDIKSHLHRLELRLLGEFDEQFNSRSWINTNVINGDEIILAKKVEKFYQQQINIILSDLINKYKERDFKSVYIEGLLQTDNQVQFRVIENVYQTLKIYKEKEIILID